MTKLSLDSWRGSW